MVRRVKLLALLMAAVPAMLHGQAAKGRVDVDHYTIDAEINPVAQTLSARAAVHLVALDEGVNSAAFELNGALAIGKVTDDQGHTMNPSRSGTEAGFRIGFDPLPKGKALTLTFTYSGKLTGAEDSPVYGIKLAAIHPDYAFLMYPGRWFPVSGYSTDRFAADVNVTVPAGYRVIATGVPTSQVAGDKTVFSFRSAQRSFPGSIAVSKDAPNRINAEGVSTEIYFRGTEKDAERAWGDQTAQVINYFSGLFGRAPYVNLTLVETEAGAPAGYAAPGIIFLNPRSIGHDVNPKLLANYVSRQWWEVGLSPATRNHLWLENGLAAYSEGLWLEHTSGSGALDTIMKADTTEALTVDNVPIIQSARLEDFSPEFWALTASKGAAVLNMLRATLGDEKFYQTLKSFYSQYVWKPVTTEDFRKTAEATAGQDLKWFFLQWIESSGAPEFKLEYTIFRTQKGFRVVGKISQDLDTFRMPVEIKIETEGNPELKTIEVAGTSSEFSIDTFGKPKNVVIDPAGKLLRYGPSVRVAVAIRKGEEFAEISEFTEALQQYQKALETSRNSSLAHYRIAEVYFLQNNFQSAANEFREALNGDLEPKWIEVWAHIKLGNIFDITSQRERAVNEYEHARRTNDNTQGAQDEVAKYLKTPYERKKSAGDNV
ncbi:MAG TPA: peptidase M1 [Solibacterales bacterium]|nr:peptidase M1 [Bryobacterales bacterium]